MAVLIFLFSIVLSKYYLGEGAKWYAFEVRLFYLFDKKIK